MAYTDAATVKKYAYVTYKQLDYATETDYDNFITTTLIPATEALVNNHCHRDFTVHTDQVEYHIGDGGTILVPNHRPVLSVASIKVDGLTLDPAAYRLQGNAIRIRPRRSETFTKDAEVELTYTYGYNSVPRDVGEVTAKIVAKGLQTFVVNKMGPLIRVDDWRVQLADENTFTPDLKTALQPYVQLEFTA